jgi:hypothetical protein
VALLAVAYLALPLLARLEQGVVPTFSDGAAATVPQFEGSGAHILGYAHGEKITVTVPLTNRGPVALTVTEVRLTEQPHPLVDVLSAAAGGRPLPVTLSPGETVPVELAARFGNCRHHNERQVQTMPGAIVTGHVLGRPTRDVVDFDHAVVAPSPMIVGCPDRTLDRDES